MALQPSAKKQKTRAKPQPQPQQPPRQASGSKASTPVKAKGAKANVGLQPTSMVHRQAAHAVARLLAADASQREGATLKSLTLAPHIVAKKVRSSPCRLGCLALENKACFPTPLATK